MPSLEHRIPPPVVGLLVAVAMWFVAAWPPALPLPVWPRHAVSALLLLAGLSLDLCGLVAFRRRRTTINPMRPANASTLVTGGIYRFTRNPMYLGLLLVLTAWAVHLSSPWPFLGPVAFVLYIGRFQIAPEERALQARFGTAWTDYAARVRRWV